MNCERVAPGTGDRHMLDMLGGDREDRDLAMIHDFGGCDCGGEKWRRAAITRVVWGGGGGYMRPIDVHVQWVVER